MAGEDFQQPAAPQERKGCRDIFWYALRATLLSVGGGTVAGIELGAMFNYLKFPQILSDAILIGVPALVGSICLEKMFEGSINPKFKKIALTAAGCVIGGLLYKFYF